jgi:hypothetical protein
MENMRFLPTIAHTSLGYGCIPTIFDGRIHRSRDNVPKLDAGRRSNYSYLDSRANIRTIGHLIFTLLTEACTPSATQAR